MNKNTYVVIMAGGVGSRFWPYSRNNHPKQFLDVLGTGKSLIQMTVERFQKICLPENIYIVTNEDYYGLVKEQIPQMEDAQILLEPTKRNTAPCIAYACYKIGVRNPDATIIVAPSDHAIFKETEFVEVIEKAVIGAESGEKLITLGIKPHRPETGYGYIQYIHDDAEEIKKVKTFTEKPEYDLAVKFIESGDFVWNAGLFIWKISAIKKAFKAYQPELDEIFAEGLSHYYKDDEKDFVFAAYAQCKSISIDYAIMEKAENVYMILGDFGWSDLGSWASLHDIKEKDKKANVLEGNVMAYDTKNSIIRSSSNEKLIVVQGLDGYLVTENDNVILICKKDDEKQFREFVKDVKAKKGDEYI